jgi:multidrug efflux system membrane fusion protein
VQSHPGFPATGKPGQLPAFDPAASLVRPPKTCQDNDIVMTTSIRLAAIVLALSSALASCSTPPAVGGQAPAGARGGGRGAGAAVPVLTARVEQKAMPVTLPAVGTVEAISTVQIRAQVTGQLSAIHFTEGQEVQGGEPLFSLDSRPFQAALKQAEAVLARDTATLQNAQSQLARNENLVERGLVTRDQYETQRATVGALTATVAADRAAIETARLNLQYTEIGAPISGRTGALGAHVGDLVRANDTAALVVINQLSPVYVTFSVPGRFLSEIRRYQAQKPLTATAVVPSGIGTAGEAPAGPGTPPIPPPGSSSPSQSISLPPQAPEAGTVTFIDNMVDSATGTIRLKATFPNPGRQLWPGAFVQVTLNLTTDPDALVVPATAVQASQDGQYVYVVKPDRTVELRTVTLERLQSGQAIVSAGIVAGETVVTDGQLRLTPGARIVERGDAGAGRGESGSRRGGQ